MARGRRPAGAAAVSGLEGSAEAKARLEGILEALAGGGAVGGVCRRLGQLGPRTGVATLRSWATLAWRDTLQSQVAEDIPRYRRRGAVQVYTVSIPVGTKDREFEAYTRLLAEVGI